MTIRALDSLPIVALSVGGWGPLFSSECSILWIAVAEEPMQADAVDPPRFRSFKLSIGGLKIKSRTSSDGNNRCHHHEKEDGRNSKEDTIL